MNFIKNIGYNTINVVVNQISIIIVTILLARWLNPTDYGIYASLSILISFTFVISEFGSASYLIKCRVLDEKTVSSAFLINVLLLGIISSLLFTFSESIAYFFGHDNAMSIKIVILPLVFGVLSGFYKSIIERNLEFKTVAKVEILATVLSSLIAIILAYKGYGVYSLVWQLSIRNIITFVYYFNKSGLSLEADFCFTKMKEIFRFSVFLVLNNIFNQFSRTSDQVIIARTLSTQALGIYSLAYKIMLFPVQRISTIVCKVMYPSLAKIQDDLEKLRVNYSQTVVLVSSVTFPAMIFVWLNSEWLVNTFLGEQWKEVSVLLKYLVPVGLIQSVVSTVGPLYLLKSKTKEGFYFQVITTLLTVVSFIVGSKWGIIGICKAYLIINVVMFIPSLYIPYSFYGIPINSILSKVLFILVFSVLSLGVVKLLIGMISISSILLIFMQVVIFLSITLCFLFTFKKGLTI
ncbi:lipopolysaccharide biosynthesis protein [Vibrio natriegens]